MKKYTYFLQTFSEKFMDMTITYGMEIIQKAKWHILPNSHVKIPIKSIPGGGNRLSFISTWNYWRLFLKENQHEQLQKNYLNDIGTFNLSTQNNDPSITMCFFMVFFSRNQWYRKEVKDNNIRSHLLWVTKGANRLKARSAHEGVTQKMWNSQNKMLILVIPENTVF